MNKNLFPTLLKGGKEVTVHMNVHRIPSESFEKLSSTQNRNSDVVDGVIAILIDLILTLRVEYECLSECF